MIEIIMTVNNRIIERDRISPKACRELVTGAIMGLVQDHDAAHKQITGAMEAIESGQTIRIDNHQAGTAMIFQVYRNK